jgi:all-trans-retinol 13,14-reductase
MQGWAQDSFVPRDQLPSDAFDVVVVGSGMAGLSSALILAKEGLKVCVLEQHYRVGGCLHRFFRHRVPFDTGFHYLGGADGDSALARYLRYLGVRDQLHFHPMDQDAFDLLSFPGLTFPVPAGWKNLVTRLKEYFPREKKGIDHYAKVCQQICRNSPAYSFKLSNGNEHQYSTVALGPFLRSITDDPRLRAILAGQSLLYGVEPEETPLDVHALVIDSMLDHPSGLDGGGDALAQVMVTAIKSYGRVVRTRAPVVALEAKDKRLVAARLHSGERVHGRCFISNAHPKVTVGLLEPGVVRPAYISRVNDMTESVSCVGGYFTHDVPGIARRHHNIYAYRTWDVDEVYRSYDRGIFLTFPSDREATWSGPRVILALKLMLYEDVEKFAQTKSGKRGEEYDALKERHAVRMEQDIVAELPELKGHLKRVEISTPLTYRDYTNTPRGSVYGIRRSLSQSGRYALHARTRVPNLLLTGQSTLMPGVVGVTVSAFVTCAFLLGFESLFGKVARA